MDMKIKELGEAGLVKRLAKRFRLDNTVIKGSGDDTAVLRWTKDKYLLFTCDMVVEGVHFDLKKAAPFQIGWKALARNISDIAAMGGVPRYALVSIGLLPSTSVKFLDELYRGIQKCAKAFNVNIVGGDTARSKKLVIDVSLIGEVEKENVVFRSGAETGDIIFVTGSLGGSIKGKHLNFMPRLKEARALVKNFKISSMIDISDGLALDLWRVLDASKVGARIYKDAVPISSEADSFEKAISEGEDFELLFTMSPGEAKRFFKRARPKIGAPVTMIGRIVDKRYGYNLKSKGYLHF